MQIPTVVHGSPYICLSRSHSVFNVVVVACLSPPAMETMETQECLDALTEKSKAGNEMVANLVQSLGSALVYPDAGNFDTNRKLWDNYAAEWEPNARCYFPDCPRTAPSARTIQNVYWCIHPFANKFH